MVNTDQENHDRQMALSAFNHFMKQDRGGVNTPHRWYQVRNEAQTGGEPEILIYDVIESIFGVSPADFMQDLAKIDAPAITVRINSPGGDVFGGIAILNALRGHDAQITTVVDGVAASIASVIAMGGDEVVMNKNSQMMIHNAWDIVIGNADELQQAADRLRGFSANIASVYAERAGGSVADWQALMDAETWYTADEAVAAGLADRVLVDTQKDSAMASYPRASAFDLSKFRYAGRQAAPAPQIAARAQTPPPVQVEENEGKEPVVATLTESALQKLGLDADADEDAIEAAIDEKIAAAETQPEPEPVTPPEPTPEQITQAAAKFNLTVMDKAVADQMVEQARLGAEARAQQLAEADERTIVDALKNGKITAASSPTWREQLGKNRETTLALLAAMPENRAMATAEIGYGAANEDTSVDPEMETLLAKVTGKA